MSLKQLIIRCRICTKNKIQIWKEYVLRTHFFRQKRNRNHTFVERQFCFRAVESKIPLSNNFALSNSSRRTRIHDKEIGSHLFVFKRLFEKYIKKLTFYHIFVIYFYTYLLGKFKPSKSNQFKHWIGTESNLNNNSLNPPLSFSDKAPIRFWIFTIPTHDKLTLFDSFSVMVIFF